jgi:hypothetical protein
MAGGGRRREHRCGTGDPPNKARLSRAQQSSGVTVRWREAAARRRQAPVVGGELRWVLQHEGGMGSEEGLMVEDDDGRRWELIVRGLKRWRRLQFPGGAAAAGVARRQGGWGGGSLGVLLARKKGVRGENLGTAMTGAF